MGLCEDDPSCDNTYNAVMPLSRAPTHGRYSHIVGVTIPKVIGVEIPVQEPGLYYSSPPRPPRTMLGMYLYQVFVHVKEVVNPSIEVLPLQLVPGSVDDVHYRSQRQTFPVLLGTMDGTGPTPSRGGGHCFFGRRGRAGCLDVL